MKKGFKYILCLFISLFLLTSVQALELDIHSTNAILYNTNDDKVLYEKNENEKNCRSGNDGKYGSSNSSWMWK